MKAPISKAKYLEFTAFACHDKLYRKAREVLLPDVGEMFYFYEYFCAQPVFRNEIQAAHAKARVCVPYMSRLVNHSQWLPSWPPGRAPRSLGLVKYQSRTAQLVQQQRWLEPIVVSLKDSQLGKDLLTQWGASRRGTTVFKACTMQGAHIDDLYRTTIAQCQRTDRESWAKVYSLTGLTWTRLNSYENVRILYSACPIATPNVFYGYLMLSALDQWGTRHISERDRWLKKKWSILRESVVDAYYLPVLTLFENTYNERVVKSSFEHALKAPRRPRAWAELTRDRSLTFARKEIHTLYARGSGFPRLSTSERLEQRICTIWSWRRDLLEAAALKDAAKAKGGAVEAEDESALTKKALAAISGSFIFAKYFVSSPGLVKCITSILDFNLSNSNDYLPSVLVVGGPGSGKDKMAKLVKLMSHETFSLGPACDTNMAMLRPRAITVPLLVGVNTDGFNIKGLFAQAVGALEDDAIAQMQKERQKNTNFTMILDELNSMDVDSQGALLRILENREVVPLGSIGKKPLDCLVIGIMNEDPERLTKQELAHTIEGSRRVLGDLLTDMIAEHLQTAKRLRSDLYYRIIRGGEVTIPDLRDRREDIPLLFFHFCQTELDVLRKQRASPPVAGRQTVSSDSDNYVNVEHAALEILLTTKRPWQGNTRELQAIAHLAFRIASQKNTSVDRAAIEEAFREYEKSDTRE